MLMQLTICNQDIFYLTNLYLIFCKKKKQYWYISKKIYNVFDRKLVVIF